MRLVNGGMQRTSTLRAGVGGSAVTLLIALALVVDFWPVGLARAVTPEVGRGAPVRAAQTCETTITLESPAAGLVRGKVEVSGWAADPAAIEGSGVSAVQVWLGGPPGEGMLLGDAELGVSRPDLEAVSPNLAGAGFRYIWDTAAYSGTATLYIAVATACGVSWVGQEVTVVPATPAAVASPAARGTPAAAGTPRCQARIVVDQREIAVGSTGLITITGWAADPGATTGAGVSRVGLWFGPEPLGEPAATATYGLTRPDATEALGNPRFGRSGFTIRLDAAAIPADAAALTIAASAACGTVSASVPLVRADAATQAGGPTPSGTVAATGAVSGTVPVLSAGTPSAVRPISGTAAVTATRAVSPTNPPIVFNPPVFVQKAEQQAVTGSRDTRMVVVTFTPQPNAKQYTLYRATSQAGPFGEVATAPGDASTVLDVQVLQPGTYYYYIVATYDRGVTSPQSNIVSAVVK